MTNNLNRPIEYDAVLGSQNVPSNDAAVLGGIEKIIKRLADADLNVRITALAETLKYGEQGLDLLFHALKDKAQPISQTAYRLIELVTQSNSLDPFHQKSLKILEKFLAIQDWRKADEVTQGIMLKIGDRQKDGYLREKDLAEFPLVLIQTIDSLWLQHSQNRFGFSIQTQIWQKIGGTSKPDWNAWCRFGDRVGWFVGDSWLHWNDVTFSLLAPRGHLPRGGAFEGWGLGDFWKGCPTLSILATKFAPQALNFNSDAFGFRSL